MPNGGTLTLITEDATDEIYITIEDTGIGIPKENLSKIFEPFFTTKEMGKGTGMGLAITYGIIKMHRGQITVESNDNPKDGPTGTRFYISLPRYVSPTNGIKELDIKEWFHEAEMIEDISKSS